MEELLKLKVITPEKSNPLIECDSVHIMVAEKGDSPFGGSYGIRKGHVKTVFALSKGNIDAFLKSKKVYSKHISGGLCLVDSDIITVLPEE